MRRSKRCVSFLTKETANKHSRIVPASAFRAFVLFLSWFRLPGSHCAPNLKTQLKLSICILSCSFLLFIVVFFLASEIISNSLLKKKSPASDLTSVKFQDSTQPTAVPPAALGCHCPLGEQPLGPRRPGRARRGRIAAQRHHLLQKPLQ